MIEMSQDGRPWLRRYQDVPDPVVRLICFPHAGGGASFFRRWSTCLPPRFDLRAVQYPGREDRLREAFAESLTDIADEVAATLRPRPGVPLVLFGHSLGAAIAYEVARRMTGPGAPALLVVSGRHAPRDPGRNVHRRSDDEIWAEVRAAGGTSDDLMGNAELRELLLPLLRADYRLSERYHPAPEPVLTCPILACSGDKDADVDLSLLPSWSRLTTGTFAMRVFPGGHFYLLDELDALLAEITARTPLTGTPWMAAP
jgi:pyochelin biosynthetic protein PchC